MKIITSILVKFLNTFLLKKIIFCLIAFTSLSTLMLAQNNLTYYKVLIKYTENNVFETLAENNLYVDHAAKSDKGFVVVFDNNELENLKSSGVLYDILIDDLEAYNKKRIAEYAKDEALQKRLKTNEPGFDLGSHAGYYTPQEMVNKLDELANDYPSIVAAKTVIGTTYEGRDIYMLKISDNPNTDESATEPVVYYDAMQHAREPLSMMTTMYYMFWLVENYGTDPVATKLVNDRELYFVPIVNVDGYEYNITTSPQGGGLWRKTRRPNPGSNCIGTDPNRNYSYDWGVAGASSDPCDNTYKGENAFSENCTQAVKDFVDAIKPVTAFSSHSYSEIYLESAWEEEDQEEFYTDYSLDMCEDHDFPYGQGTYILYTSTGNTRDYLASIGAAAYTPEIGTEFWEPASLIETYAQRHLLSFIYIAQVAGDFPDIKQAVINDNADLLPGGNFDIDVEVFNKGKSKAAQNVSVKIVSNSQNVTIADSETVLTSVPNRQAIWNDSNDPITVSIDTNAAYGDIIEIELAVIADGVEYEKEKHSWVVGEQNILFSEDASNGLGNFTQSSNGIFWDTTYVMKRSGNESFTDSKLGSANNETTSYLSMTSPVNLGYFSEPVLEFWIAWGLANHTRNGGTPTDDNLCLEMKLDNSDWVDVETDNTQLINSKNCYVLNNGWVKQMVDLSPYKGSSVQFRFALETSSSSRPDGVFIDDFRIVDYQDDAIILPIAIINENGPITINEGESVSLTQSSTDFDSLLWSSGDGQTSTDNQVNFTYLTPGTYTVTLAATNTNGTEIASITIIVNPVGLLDCPTEDIYLRSQEEVDAFVQNYAHCTVLDVRLHIKSETGTPINDISGLEFLTDVFGIYIENNTALTSLDGLRNVQNVINFIMLDNPLLTDCNYPNICHFVDNFNIVTFIFDNGSSCKDEDEITEICHGTDLPTAVILETGPITILAGETVYLTSRSLKYSDLLWDAGFGTSNYTNVNITYDTPGTFIVTHTVTNANGSDTATITIIVLAPANDLPVPIIDGDVEMTITEGESIDLTHSSTNYDSLLWNSGDGQTSTDNEVSFTYNNAGTYTVTLEATNANGSNIAEITVIVNEPVIGSPTATIDGNTTLTINQGETINLTQSSTNYDSLLWNSGDGQTSTDSQVSFTYNNVGTFVVTLEATNVNGSDGSAIFVIVNPQVGCIDQSLIDPGGICTGEVKIVCGCDGQTYNSICVAASQFGISEFTIGDCADPYVQNFTICEDESVQLNPSEYWTSSSIWSPTTGLSCTDCRNPMASPSSTTTYTLTAPIGDITIISKFKVEVDQSCTFPTAVINEVNPVIINEGESVNLTQSSTNYDSLLWSSSDGQTSTNSQVNFTYNTAGTYTVTLEATNTNGSDVAEITIIVNEITIVNEDCEADTLIYTTPNPIPDATHKKIKDWILFPDNNGAIEVKSNTTSSFKAGNYIDIKTDFKVEAGAEFLLDIEDCEEQDCVTDNNNLYGGTGVDYVEYMEVTADGGYIMAGYTTSSQSGDVPGVNAGANDFWVMKLSENREIEWSKLYGESIQDKAYSIRQTTDGGFVVAGTSLPTDSIDYVGSVIKLDSNGDEIWNTPLSNPGLDLTVREIIETKDGGYMAVGYFSDGTLSNSFTIKLDANGELTGARSYGVSHALSIDQAPNGNYYLSGYDNYTTDGVEDNIWIAYLDENEADIIWQNLYGLDSANEVCIDGIVLPDGKFVAGGSTEESGNYDYQIFKIDTTGNLVWATVIGGDGRDIVYSIESTNDGGFIVGGHSNSSNSGDVDMTNNGGRDFWIVKLNSAGSVEWKNLIGGSNDDELRSIHQTEDGGYIVAGNSLSSISGDIEDASNGNRDVWFVKLNANGEIETSDDCN